MKKIIYLFIVTLFIASCSSDPAPVDVVTDPPKTEELVASIGYDVTGKLPHDITAYTEGFLYHNKQLYESTGAPENIANLKTMVGILDTAKGKLDAKIDLGREFFGEGIVILNDKIYQLTYKDQIGFVYDAKTYKQLLKFSYSNKEGWGFTTDGTSLIMSDGTNVLTYLDPETLKPVKTLNVTNAGYAEDNINELEFVDGYVYANIWMKNYIVKIDLTSGKVVGTMDCSQLTDEAHRMNPDADVLNGIAYDAATKRMFVTGKMFPNVYILKLR